MKKLYIQPQTDDVLLASGTLMELNAGSDAPAGAWGAPMRQFSGQVQGLKYLI